MTATRDSPAGRELGVERTETRWLLRVELGLSGQELGVDDLSDTNLSSVDAHLHFSDSDSCSFIPNLKISSSCAKREEPDQFFNKSISSLSELGTNRGRD